MCTAARSSNQIGGRFYDAGIISGVGLFSSYNLFLEGRRLTTTPSTSQPLIKCRVIVAGVHAQINYEIHESVVGPM